MSADRFDLRRFHVFHDRSTMRVGTDALLLGAWADLTNAHRVLDIGTGSGLIALIAAQRAPHALVDAVEIDAASARQAQENAAASPWSDRIRIHHMDVRRLRTATPFDRIISNPPFHTTHSPSPDDRRAAARHGSALAFPELLVVIERCLSEDGHAALIVPTERKADLLREALEVGLAVHRSCNVRYVAGRPPRRVLIELGRTGADVLDPDIAVMQPDGEEYTIGYQEMMYDLLDRVQVQASSSSSWKRMPNSSSSSSTGT